VSDASTPLSRVTIVSGGQTGADRAALDFAIDHALPHEGWCPRGRLAEDGPIDERYQLRETESRKYAKRTAQNIHDSDATVVFSLVANPTGGTALTIDLTERIGRPLLHLPRDADPLGATAAAIRNAADSLNQFIDAHEVKLLNVAGPRSSVEPKVASYVRSVLAAALVAE